MPRRFTTTIGLMAGLFVLVSSLEAAKPNVTGTFPPGVQLGKTTVVNILGSTGTGTPQSWSSSPHVKITAAGKGKVRVAVSKKAAPGLLWFRLTNKEGASTLRPLMIGTLPESVEKEPNNGVSQSNSVALPRVMNGKLGSGDVDSYRVKLTKGQHFVAQVTAHHLLAYSMDGALQICNAEGIVLAQTDDTRGYDPMLVFRAPATGDYLVRVFAFPIKPNSSIAFSGGATYIYRLTMTNRGYVDHAFPMAVSSQKGSPAVQLQGWNLAKTLQQATQERAQIVFQSTACSFVELPIVDCGTAVAGKQTLTKGGQLLSLPVVVSGRIAQQRQVHRFAVDGKKGKRIKIKVEARQLGFELDPIVEVFDSKNNRLLSQDDARGKRDVEASFVPKTDGRHVIQIRDTHEHGGFRYVYRMTVAPDEKDFQLQLSNESLAVPRGGTASVDVSIVRSGGLNDGIEIDAVNLPPGLTVKKVVSKGKTAKKLKLVFAASAKPTGGSIRIRGRVGKRTRFGTFAVLSTRRSDFWINSVPAKKKK